MGRVARAVLVVVAVAMLAVAVAVIKHNSPVPEAGQTLTLPAEPSSGAQGSNAQGSSAQGDPSASRQTPVVAFLGDDWTVGVGASSKGKRFTTLLSSQLHLTERNFGVVGAGYAKTSPGGATYAARVSAIVAADPQVVIVSGGRNDTTDLAATAAAAAKKLFRLLRAGLPHATLIAVAPMWGDSDLPPEMVALGRAVKSAVTAVGGTYLPVADPIHGHPNEMADAADPNDKGYAAIANALQPALKPKLSQ